MKYAWMIVSIALMASCTGSGNKATEEEKEIVLVAPEPEPVDEPEPVKEKEPRTWAFSFEKDEMTGDTNVWARLVSDNYFIQDFPYGYTLGTVEIRYIKKYGGYDAIISISSGQIHGSSYSDNNYVMVKFDDGTPIKYWFDEASSGSSELVFIRKKNDFIARCKKATSIKVEVPLWEVGRQVFTFTVDEPLVWRTSDES